MIWIWNSTIGGSGLLEDGKMWRISSCVLQELSVFNELPASQQDNVNIESVSPSEPTPVFQIKNLSHLPKCFLFPTFLPVFQFFRNERILGSFRIKKFFCKKSAFFLFRTKKEKMKKLLSLFHLIWWNFWDWVLCNMAEPIKHAHTKFHIRLLPALLR